MPPEGPRGRLGRCVALLAVALLALVCPLLWRAAHRGRTHSGVPRLVLPDELNVSEVNHTGLGLYEKDTTNHTAAPPTANRPPRPNASVPKTSSPSAKAGSPPQPKQGKQSEPRPTSPKPRRTPNASRPAAEAPPAGLPLPRNFSAAPHRDVPVRDVPLPPGRQAFYSDGERYLAFYRKEPGLQQLKAVLEHMWGCGPARSPCPQAHHLALPRHMVTLEEYLATPPAPPGLNPPPLNVSRKYPPEDVKEYMFPNRTNRRLPFFPYIHILSFLRICDFVWAWLCEHYCTQTTFNYTRITNRSLVYWQLWNPDLRRLQAALPHIPNHFFLVAHELDHITIPPDVIDHPKVLRVFALNCNASFRHPKLVPLPLGISKGVSIHLRDFHAARQANTTPTLLLQALFEFGGRGSRRYHRRLAASRALRGNGVVARQASPRALVGLLPWVRAAKSFLFQACPAGEGLDTYRLWETFAIGRLPVLPPMLLPGLFDELPVVVNPWPAVTEPALLGRVAEMRQQRFNYAQAWMPWWVTFILLQCLEVP